MGTSIACDTIYSYWRSKKELLLNSNSQAYFSSEIDPNCIFRPRQLSNDFISGSINRHFLYLYEGYNIKEILATREKCEENLLKTQRDLLTLRTHFVAKDENFRDIYKSIIRVHFLELLKSDEFGFRSG